MDEFELSTPAQQMMLERNIMEEWVWRTINTPKRRRRGEDENMHYTRKRWTCFTYRRQSEY